MSEDISGVEPRGEKDVRPRDITETGAGRLAVQGTDQTSITARPSMGETIGSPTPGLARSYVAAMAALRAQTARLHPPHPPQPRY